MARLIVDKKVPELLQDSTIFSLDMEVQVPVDQPVNELREELQSLAAEENIDVTFLPAS